MKKNYKIIYTGDSGKSKKIRRAMRKEASKIKAQGLIEFVDFCNNHNFFKRAIIAFKILFKLVKK